MPEVKIKELRASDTYDLRHKVMWPDHPIDFIKLPEDDEGIHFGLFHSSKLTSIISLFIYGKEAQFRKFATESSEQGKGYGSLLLRHIIDFASSKGINRIWCNARIDKANYYEKFGFTKTNNTYVKGGVNFVVLERISILNS